MSNDRQNLGRRGEDIATRFLEKQGYQIITRNFRTALGEIDIVVKDKSSIVFVEVKSRSGSGYGSPASAVTLKKQRQISRVALLYIKEHNLHDAPARFDVVSIVFCRDNSRIEHITDAFELCY